MGNYGRGDQSIFTYTTAAVCKTTLHSTSYFKQEFRPHSCYGPFGSCIVESGCMLCVIKSLLFLRRNHSSDADAVVDVISSMSEAENSTDLISCFLARLQKMDFLLGISVLFSSTNIWTFLNQDTFTWEAKVLFSKKNYLVFWKMY